MNILLQSFANLFLAISAPTTHFDSLNHLVRPDFELVDLYIADDSLALVSMSDFLYYPFGRFENENKFIDKNSFFTSSCILNIKDDDDSEYNIELTQFTHKSSTLFTINGESGFLEIVKLNVIDQEIKFINEIFVGMDKDTFFGKFFINSNTKKLCNIKKIVLVSGLQGIWHYYFFKNDHLDRIYIRTDYTVFEKLE